MSFLLSWHRQAPPWEAKRALIPVCTSVHSTHRHFPAPRGHCVTTAGNWIGKTCTALKSGPSIKPLMFTALAHQMCVTIACCAEPGYGIFSQGNIHFSYPLILCLEFPRAKGGMGDPNSTTDRAAQQSANEILFLVPVQLSPSWVLASMTHLHFSKGTGWNWEWQK